MATAPATTLARSGADTTRGRYRPRSLLSAIPQSRMQRGCERAAARRGCVYAFGSLRAHAHRRHLRVARSDDAVFLESGEEGFAAELAALVLRQ